MKQVAADYTEVHKSALQILTERPTIVVASEDKVKIALTIIDAQNTFCHPLCKDELLIPGAWEDNTRLAEFIRENIEILTKIFASLDTHVPMQIFFPMFWLDAMEHHPDPYTVITHQDVLTGKWKINPEVGRVYGKTDQWLAERALYYTSNTTLVIWSLHGLLGSFGHALDPRIEEAILLHEMVRQTNRVEIIKGTHPFTEFYSIFEPDVETDGANIITIGSELLIPDDFADPLLDDLISDFSYRIFAGQAMSHCLAASIDSFLERLTFLEDVSMGSDSLMMDLVCSREVCNRTYILTDCTSPVPSFEEQANAAFERFANAGIHLVESKTPMKNWPDIQLN